MLHSEFKAPDQDGGELGEQAAARYRVGILKEPLAETLDIETCVKPALEYTLGNDALMNRSFIEVPFVRFECDFLKLLIAMRHGGYTNWP